jgi:hypothetical protein
MNELIIIENICNPIHIPNNYHRDSIYYSKEYGSTLFKLKLLTYIVFIIKICSIVLIYFILCIHFILIIIFNYFFFFINDFIFPNII